MMPSAPAPRRSVTTAIRDGFMNMITSLGTSKDPRSSTTYSLDIIDPNQLLTAYRSNWLAAKIVDCFAEDATREWRSWQASEEQIQKLEDAEKTLNVQRTVKQALIRARLFGGAAIIMGVDGAGEVNEPLDLEAVEEGSLKFLLVLSSFEMSRGQMIVDANDPYFGRPEYYRINTGRAELAEAGSVTALQDIHPSRVIEFVGREIPSWDVTNGSNTWGDSVLQAVDDVLKDYGTSIGSIAAMINDSKVDVFTIPGLTKNIANKDYENRLTTRLTVSNQMKSMINAMVMDENEKWERVQTQFGGLPQIMGEFAKLVAGASGIAMTRLFGHGSGSGTSSLGGGSSGGDSDLHNYYDDVMSDQKTEISPRMATLDEVLERSALGTYDDQIYYEWQPLYVQEPLQKAQTDYTKAQTFSIDASAGLINPDALRSARINQLVEDGTYPGLQDAIDEYGEEPDEPEVGPEDVQAHLQMLQRSSQQLQQLTGPKNQPTQTGADQ